MLARYLSLVKFSHTIFAMPFAMVGLMMGFRDLARAKFVGSDYLQTLAAFDVWKLLYVLMCMVFARSAAMAFNRWADQHFDAQNERTKIREIPSGKISSGAALSFVIFNAVAFMACSWLINKLCFYLSPVALVVILGYSYTKRFTALCHLVLGLGLALAPIGAYLAVTEQFSLSILVLGFSVLTWTSGFDIIYALQDEAFDRQQDLKSIPVFVGKTYAIYISVFLHILTALALIFLAWMIRAAWIFWLGTGLFILFLIAQHRVVKPTDLSKINLAFFTFNGIASLLFGTLAIIDLLVFPYRY
jgi:4-hydroxybenzoate polyprenyltransferase